MNNVKLIVVTPYAEQLILKIARVSSNQENTDPGLLGYLIRNGHWSPFEHAHMTLEITTSRAIGTQILRHRSFTFQEFSQRYAAATGILYHHGVRVKGATNRQGSIKSDDKELEAMWYKMQMRVFNESMEAYELAIEEGIAPEMARFLLPLATQTTLYMTGTLRSWIHYLGDGPGGRTNEHTQLEHRQLALEGKEIFCEQFPIIAKALDW